MSFAVIVVFINDHYGICASDSLLADELRRRLIDWLNIRVNFNICTFVIQMVEWVITTCIYLCYKLSAHCTMCKLCASYIDEVNPICVTGAQPRLKSWGEPRFGPQHRGMCPAKGRAGCWVREGSPPPTVRVRGYHPRKFFENSDTKSCILVTTSCEISCFLKTMAKKLGDQYIIGPPNLKVGGTSLPCPYGCCAYAVSTKSSTVTVM